MKEKDFHKKIEKYLTEEERLNKEKDWEIIIKNTGYSEEEKKGNCNFTKLIPILTVIVLCFVIPVFIFLQKSSLINEAGSSKTSTSNVSSFKSEESVNSTNNEHIETLVPAFCVGGVIKVENENKYFYSSNGLYRVLITAETPLETYNNSLLLDYKEIVSDTPAFAMIVTENNKIFFPNNQIGDLLKIIIK